MSLLLLYGSTPAPIVPTIDYGFFLLLSGTGASAPAIPPQGDGFKVGLQAFLVAGLGSAVKQVSPGRAFELDTYPALIYTVVNRGYEALLAGPAKVRSATVEIRVQDQGNSATDAVMALIVALFHAQTNYAMGSLTVIDSFADLDADDYDDPDDATDDGTYEDSITIVFHYRIP